MTAKGQRPVRARAADGARRGVRNRPGPGRPCDPELQARRREEIIEIATRLFARDGFAGTDLQDVADELGVGKGTLYRYFPSKCALFQAAVDHVMISMRRVIDGAIETVEDPIEKIAVAIQRYLMFFQNHPENVELLIQERSEFRDRKNPTYFAHREANAERWHELYRGLMRDGRVREMPVERITDVLGDLIYGTMFTNHIARRKRSLASQAEGILDLAFNGLLTARERKRRAANRGENKG